MHQITKKRRLLITVATLMAVLSLGAAPALGASPHNSTLYTNNGCSWDGYHRYTLMSISGGVTADTEKKGGNCVEVHVRLWINGSSTPLQAWHPTKAVASASGWISSFQHSDHNADPAGPPPLIGFPLY